MPRDDDGRAACPRPAACPRLKLEIMGEEEEEDDGGVVLVEASPSPRAGKNKKHKTAAEGRNREGESKRRYEKISRVVIAEQKLRLQVTQLQHELSQERVKVEDVSALRDQVAQLQSELSQERGRRIELEGELAIANARLRQLSGRRRGHHDSIILA